MSILLERLRAALGDEYEIERELAAGGMGIVFLARERALGNRPVALKILRPELATAAAAERFQREARLLAAVRHPSVVTIHRVDQRDGIFYFVMELLGPTLAERILEAPLPAGAAVTLGCELLDGLARVHEAGIVHRDIKPSNVFLRDDGRAVLGDFGIARREDASHTDAGRQVGTPVYMPPEQAAGTRITQATDLYAVGMVLYEALTRRRWTVGMDPRKAAWTGVPRRIGRVLRRALNVDPARRWGAAREFADALRSAGTASWRARVVWTAAAVMLLGVVLLGPWQRPAAGPEDSDVAVLPFAVEGAGADVGEVLAVWVEQHLRRAFGDSGLRVTPEALAAPWATRLGPASGLPPAAWDDLRTDRVVRGVIRVSGDTLAVEAALVARDGAETRLARVTGTRADQEGIGYRVAHAIVQVVRPADAARFVGLQSLSDVSAATRALIAAEYAFQRDNWMAAEALYREAIALDSSLALAWWGLYNARRWQRLPPDVDLGAVYARHAGRFDDLERLLIEAELAGTVPERLALYAEASERFPWHAYPRLLRGNELFHRGALVGKGLDSAIVALRAAAEANPYLAPTYDMLTWAYTRAGDAERAREALATRIGLGQAQPVKDFWIAGVLQLALEMRFQPPGQAERGLREVMRSPDGPASLVRAVRLGLAFGMPEAQLQIGRELTEMPDAAVRVQGRTSQALALLAMGRPSAGAMALEAAGAVAGDDEYAFQAAQWRVLLPALGLPGIAEPERDAARAALRRALEGPRGSRARWTLLVDAVGGAAAVGPESAPDDTTTDLGALAAALVRAARGDTAGALASTAHLTLAALEARLEDPLQRAVLFLSRARWLAPGDRAAADLSLRWYENADFADWPRGHPQGAEIDWALEAYARYLRATLAEDVDARCRIIRPARQWWQSADAAFAPLRHQIEEWMRPCPAE